MFRGTLDCWLRAMKHGSCMAAQSRAIPVGFWVDICSCFYEARMRCAGEMVLERVWLISSGNLAEFTSKSKSKMGT